MTYDDHPPVFDRRWSDGKAARPALVMYVLFGR